MRKQFIKKVASIATAATISLSGLTGLALPAYAATSQGKLEIHTVDSSVYGADRTSGNISTPMKVIAGQKPNGGGNLHQAFRDYWSNTLTNKDFLETPQGLGVFDKRTLFVYDITKPDGSAYPDEAGKKPGEAGVHYSAEYLLNGHKDAHNPITQIAQLHVTRGGMLYSVDADGHETITDLGSGEPSVGWLGEGFEDNNYYVIVEDPNSANSWFGYHSNTDDAVHGTDAWEVMFKWVAGTDINLSYDNDVKSNYSDGIPLHNEVMRGNFSFNVWDKDLQGYESQGSAYIDKYIKGGTANAPIYDKPKFAVYNINTTNTKQTGAHNKWDYAWKNDGTSTSGYVIADRNLDGTLSDEERVTYVPAYEEDVIVAAYEKYLIECNTAEKYNGNYNGKIEDGEFIIGDQANGKPIIPVMILEPDDRGVVSTGSVGLPVGNYMVVQVQAGKGYYLDQDFRPIVSIGYWGGTRGQMYDQKLGYGRAYFEAIANTWPDTADYVNALENAYAVPTNSPVAFCTVGHNTNISNLNASNIGYYVSEAGQMAQNSNNHGPAWMTNNGPIYGGTNPVGASNGRYFMNADDPRMKPVAGTSRFTVQNPVIRAGFKIYMADSDDIQKNNLVAGLNLKSNGDYMIVPQGNGSLDGAKFKLTPASSAADKRCKLYTTNTTIPKAGSYTYTTKDGMLLVPVDDLPIGTYYLSQVDTGSGYELGEWGIAVVVVGAEDTPLVYYTDQVNENGELIDVNGNKATNTNDVKPSANKDNYVVNGAVYLPNTLVNGGEVYSLDSSTAPADTEIELSVYNISEQYVYVDKDDNGSEERYETNKYTYKNQIANKALTYDQALAITSRWTPCRTTTVKVGSTVTFDDTLPYGTYLVMVTSVPVGYDITGAYMTVDTITADGDNIEFETKIDNVAALPDINTLFVDAETNIDSIPIKDRVFLRDIVTVTNLVGGANYRIYGSIVDKSTGNLLKQGMVAYTTGTAYLSTDNIGTTDTDSRAAQQLLNESGKYVTFSDDYMLWLLDVRDFATATNNQTLINYCEQAIRGGSLGTDSHFADNKSRIVATLKYIARGEASTDLPLDGMLEAVVNFDVLDTTGLENTTLVAYEYICSDVGAVSKEALAAKNTGEILAALDPILVAAHRNINDENQTVYLPTLDIEAYASYTGNKTVDPSETIEGDITYGNLEIGNRYAIEAWLVDAYGMKVPMVDKSGTKIEKVRSEFTAFATTNKSVIKFEGLDAAAYNGQRLTVYSTLYRLADDQIGANKDGYWLIEKGDAASMGYSITDPEPGRNQVDITAPTVKTTLADNMGRKTVNFDRTVTLVDTVTYKGLVVGGSYNSKLTLVSTEGTTLFDDEGNELVAEYKFVATKPDVTIKIPITFKGTTLRGMDIVAFNDLYRQTDDKIALAAQEHNVLAKDQTIEATGEGFKVIISTVAMNPANNTHVVAATNNASAVDEVTVRNLEPNTQYMAKTELAYASNGTVITQFSPVETMFESDADGRAKFNVSITFNALVFKGKTLSVYQTIYDATGDNVIAIHKDYYDANQMLMVPDIDTVATADDAVAKKIVPNVEKVNVTNDPNGKTEIKYTATVLDTIKYVNLIPGNQYQITTEIVTRDGRSSLGTSSTVFIPVTATGTTTTSMDLDVTSYRGAKLVVYETITDVYSGDEVVIHKDLTDTDQTVEIVGPNDDDDDETSEPDDDDPDDSDEPTGETSKPDDDPDDPDDPGDEGKPGTNINTGVDEKYALLFAIAGGIFLAAGVFAAIYICKRKKDK